MYTSIEGFYFWLFRFFDHKAFMSHFVVLQTVGKHGIKISSTKFFCSNFEGGFSIACLVKHAKRSEYLSTGSMLVLAPPDFQTFLRPCIWTYFFNRQMKRILDDILPLNFKSKFFIYSSNIICRVTLQIHLKFIHSFINSFIHQFIH